METVTQQLKKFEIKIQSLGDQDLVQTLQKLLEREKRIGDAILLALKEIRTRRIYAAMGYSSLFEMLVKHFKLSESSTYSRLQALKLMDAVPEVQADLASGDLSLSNAALIQGFIQRSEKETQKPLSLEKKKDLIDSVKNKSNREAKVELAKKDPEFALPPEKEKPLALNYTQLQITVDAETMEVLNEVKNLLSHTIPDGNLKDVLKYMLTLTAQTLKKRKGQDTLKENNSFSSENADTYLIQSNSLPSENVKIEIGTVEDKTDFAKLTNSGTDVQSKDGIKGQNEKKFKYRFISQFTKRKVFQRSGGNCEFVSNNGKRCQSKHQLEWDHIIPWSQGGGKDERSLRVYCRTHNQYRTKETHGFWYQKPDLKFKSYKQTS